MSSFPESSIDLSRAVHRSDEPNEATIFFFFFKSEFRLKWRQKRRIAEILWKNSIKSANLHIQIKFTLRVESDVLNTVVNFKSLTFYSKGQKWFFKGAVSPPIWTICLKKKLEKWKYLGQSRIHGQIPRVHERKGRLRWDEWPSWTARCCPICQNVRNRHDSLHFLLSNVQIIQSFVFHPVNYRRIPASKNQVNFLKYFFLWKVIRRTLK